MFSTDGILGRNFAITSAALDGLAMRQEVHAKNLANVQTEGYRAQTVNFEGTLDAAMQGDSPGIRFKNPLATGSSLRDGADGASLSSNFAVVAKGGKPGVDRVTETAEMATDNVRFRVLTQTVTNNISAVRSVIAEMGRG